MKGLLLTLPLECGGIQKQMKPVSDGYKNAIVNSGMDDIVLTEKLSGTPCTIINTPYAQKIGYKQNWFERLMSKNKKVNFRLLTNQTDLWPFGVLKSGPPLIASLELELRNPGIPNFYIGNHEGKALNF